MCQSARYANSSSTTHIVIRRVKHLVDQNGNPLDSQLVAPLANKSVTSSSIR